MADILQFRPAVRINTPLIIVLAGASGTGKTMSALELATGMAGDGKIAFADTEGGRALIYGNDYQFDHLNFRPPYSPNRFLEVLRLAERQGYRVIIVDSFSDEYVGDGGLVDMAAAEYERVHNTTAAWAKPKAENKLVVRWFRQATCHVILCLRAEEKVNIEKVVKSGKETTVVVPIGWQMISEKNLPYEATLSIMLHPDAPGVPQVTPGKMPTAFRKYFSTDRQINRQAGVELAEWCAGGAPAPDVPREPVPWDKPDVPKPAKHMNREPEERPMGGTENIYDPPYPGPAKTVRPRKKMAEKAKREPPPPPSREDIAAMTRQVEEMAASAEARRERLLKMAREAALVGGVDHLRYWCETLREQDRAESTHHYRDIRRRIEQDVLPTAQRARDLALDPDELAEQEKLLAALMPDIEADALPTSPSDFPATEHPE